MTVTPTGVYAQTLENFIVSIANADAQTKKTLVTPTTNGTRVNCIAVSSTDTSARDITVGVTISATNYDLFTVSIPATAGTADNVPTVFLFNQAQIPNLCFDAYGNHYVDLKSGTTLYVYAPVTVTSGKQINVFGYGADF
jgi:hypothetical protein